MSKDSKAETDCLSPGIVRPGPPISIDLFVQDNGSPPPTRTMKHFLAVLGLASTVTAHATWQQLWIGAEDKGDSCTRTVPSNSPITDVTSKDVRCNANTKAASSICDVAGKHSRVRSGISPANIDPAGDTLSVEMHQHADRACSIPAIGGNHYGPVMIYMSNVDDAATADGSSSWFKVAQDSYAGTTESWGTEMLNANCGKKSFTVPKSLAPGNYLVRAEAIALHAAGSTGSAQLYMACYQINITGSGSANPSGVEFPGAYKAR
jgi:lytic cellulose monooxygenase (C1-hydroxylating)